MTIFQRHLTNKLFYKKYAYKVVAWSSKEQYSELFKLFFEIKCSNEINLKYRSEYYSFSFFLEDSDNYERLIKKLNKFVRETWEPKNQNELELLKNDQKLTIVKQYPHGKFTHKIFLKSMSLEKRLDFLEWMKKYPEDTFKISKGTHSYLNGQRNWTQGPFILIKNSQMFTMTLLAFNDCVRSTEEFVLRENIKEK